MIRETSLGRRLHCYTLLATIILGLFASGRVLAQKKRPSKKLAVSGVVVDTADLGIGGILDHGSFGGIVVTPGPKPNLIVDPDSCCHRAECCEKGGGINIVVRNIGLGPSLPIGPPFLNRVELFCLARS